MPFPKINTNDYLRQAAKDIITILTEPLTSTTPSLETGDETRNGLLKLASLLNIANKLLNPTQIT